MQYWLLLVLVINKHSITITMPSTMPKLHHIDRCYGKDGNGISTYQVTITDVIQYWLLLMWFSTGY